MSNSNICPMCGSLAHPSAKFCYRCGCALKNGNSKSLSQNSINISSDVNPILENSVKAAGMAEGVSFFERNSQHDKYHSLLLCDNGTITDLDSTAITIFDSLAPGVVIICDGESGFGRTTNCCVATAD